jgi:hypothetical protein
MTRRCYNVRLRAPISVTGAASIEVPNMYLLRYTSIQIRKYQYRSYKT